MDPRVHDTTPLASPAAVVALWQAWADPVAVVTAVASMSTWGDLVNAPTSTRVAMLGPTLASLELPPVCPPVPALPSHTQPLTPYDPQYPNVDAATWPVLYVTGTVPRTRGVLVVGGTYPSPQGTEIARATALAAAAERVPIVVALDAGAALTAARTGVAAGAHVVAVVAHGCEVPGPYAGLVHDIVRAGGAVLTTAAPTSAPTPVSQRAQVGLAVALSAAAVITELGAPPSRAAELTTAAVAADLHLLAPAPAAHHVELNALGLQVLTTPGMFTPAWYGTNAAINARVRAGLPAVDVVVTGQNQIGDVLTQVCQRPTTA